MLYYFVMLLIAVCAWMDGAAASDESLASMSSQRFLSLESVRHAPARQLPPALREEFLTRRNAERLAQQTAAPMPGYMPSQSLQAVTPADKAATEAAARMPPEVAAKILSVFGTNQ